MSILRSLVFTLLLEEREIASMESMRGMRLVSDATDRVEQDQKRDRSLTTDAIIRQYISDVTANGTCEPGIWERYVDSLIACDQAYARGLGVQGLPEGFTIKPA